MPSQRWIVGRPWEVQKEPNMADILTYPRSLREKARKTIPAACVSSVLARLRLMETTRIFETPEKRQSRLAMEALRRTEHAAKPWLLRQRVSE